MWQIKIIMFICISQPINIYYGFRVTGKHTMFKNINQKETMLNIGYSFLRWIPISHSVVYIFVLIIQITKIFTILLIKLYVIIEIGVGKN